MKSFLGKSRSGFTLVELLIVVAIIGVLSTIGVPTFKKMVQKAKKSEAKVSLGALYTVETAFFSEYGVYGNNLSAIGYELDGTSSTRIYNSGFAINAGCTVPAAIVPMAANATSLYVAFPAYYNTANIVYEMVANNPNGCPSSATVASDGSTFIATAGGFISNNSAAPADQWSIDNLRNLSNTQDGVY